MYADLVQQLQADFSFGAFADAHGRSRDEVFDVFSAVVQLPLLHHAASGRAHVSVAACKSRCKSFRTLQQDVALAHRLEDGAAAGKKKRAGASSSTNKRQRVEPVEGQK